MKDRAKQLEAVKIFEDAIKDYEAIQERAKKRVKEPQSSMRRNKAQKIVESTDGTKYLCTYSPTFDKWLMRQAPMSKKTGTRGRPKKGDNYGIAFTFHSLRQHPGWKYAAALAATAEVYGVTTRTVIRHWNTYKDVFRWSDDISEQMRHRAKE